MGPHPAALIGLCWALGAGVALAQAPGWAFSPLPGEGDRAAMGCDREADADDFTCLVVRCEDDFTVGVHIHASRFPDALGQWELTADREEKRVLAVAGGPYDGRFVDDADWLLDRLRHGSFIYICHGDDAYAPFRFIGLDGSFRAIHDALYWCAPRVAPTEQNAAPGVSPEQENGESS